MVYKFKTINEVDKRSAREHWDNIAKPLNGLGKLEESIVQIAGILGTSDIILKGAIIAMCADNGVVAEGVTQTDQSVTAIVAANMAKGVSSVSRMAAYSGLTVFPVDIGIATKIMPEVTKSGLLDKKIAFGTKNIKKGPAMTVEEAEAAIHVGIDLVKKCKEAGYTILGTGEMGIGNTTTSSAMASVLLECQPEEVTGRGAGLSKAGLERKIEVIKEAILVNKPDPSDAFSVLQKLGGFDIAGLTGIFLGGAIYGVPIVMDGLISAIAALTAVRMYPEVNAFILPSHVGKEPATAKIMEKMKKEPVITADLALGEGTGAVLFMQMLQCAMTVYRENTTFSDIQVEVYKKYEE